MQMSILEKKCHSEFAVIPMNVSGKEAPVRNVWATQREMRKDRNEQWKKPIGWLGVGDYATHLYWIYNSAIL